eukprot:191713-Pelagomonas_calceolata.AAC.1
MKSLWMLSWISGESILRISFTTPSGPGRATHLSPRMIPAHDRDIHLVEIRFCPDTKPLPSLRTAADQHA